MNFKQFTMPTSTFNLAFAAVVLLAASVATAQAGATCGDNLNGGRVACDCGDVVVSDTRLRADDPVVTRICEANGLVVRAPHGASGIRLDLGGNKLTGSGFGTGIRVLDGGAEGAVIHGGGPGVTGYVTGFATGLKAHGTKRLKEVRRLILSENKRDGLALYGSEGALIADVVTENNGRDGARVRSHGAVLDGVEAEGNAKAGVRVTGERAQIRGDVGGNGTDSLVVRGRGHDISGVRVPEEAKADVRVRPSK